MTVARRWWRAGRVGPAPAARRARSTTPSTARLTTYNTNTVAGAASGGPQAFARVLTGFNYHGPDGQIVGDHDFGTISVVGRAPLVLDYEISDNAVYSDGKPITCDDMVLAWAAQSGRFPGFDAANQAGYRDIAAVDCAPGQKKARVSFAQDRALRRLRPAVRRDVDDAVARHRRRARRRRHRRRHAAATTARPSTASPQVWNTTWNLTPDLDLKRFPSSGPVQARLGRPRTARSCSSPTTSGGAPSPSPTGSPCGRAAPTSRTGVNNGTVDVVDVAAGSSGTLNMPDDYDRTDSPVGGHRAADLRAAGTAGRAARAARAGAVHAARRDRPQRRGADRQRPAQPGDRGRGRQRPRRRRGRTVRRRQPRRRPRRAGQSAADGADRLSDAPTRGSPRPSARSPNPARRPASPCRTPPPTPPAR